MQTKCDRAFIPTMHTWIRVLRRLRPSQTSRATSTRVNPVLQYQSTHNVGLTTIILMQHCSKCNLQAGIVVFSSAVTRVLNNKHYVSRWTSLNSTVTHSPASWQQALYLHHSAAALQLSFMFLLKKNNITTLLLKRVEMTTTTTTTRAEQIGVLVAYSVKHLQSRTEVMRRQHANCSDL